MKYRTLHLLLFVTCSLLVNSCKNGNEIKIGFLLPNQTDERTVIERALFMAKVKELGCVPLITDAQFSDQLQITQAQELIDQGAKVLVVMAVNKNTAAAIARIAHSNGVKIIAYERIIANCDLDYYISFDNVKVGELMAKYAITKKPKGKYVILNGDKNDQNAIWVKEGMLKVLEPLVKSGDIQILYNVFVEDWSGDNAYVETKKFLNLSMDIPDVILSAYDGMSRGAIKALDENEVISFPVITGQNAELLSCKYIVTGKQSMTVYKPLKTEAELAAEIAIKCARHENIKTNKTVFNGSKEVPSILIDPISVDITNMKSTIIKDKFLKESDVFGY
jgi:D-xylose transport system substrate-binding protein